VLAGSALTLTGQFATVDMSLGAGGGEANLLPALLPIILPISILVVPFADLVLAVVRRTRAGRSPFAPDKQHLHHRLLERGHSHARAVLVMYLWSAVLAFSVTAAAFLDIGTLLLFVAGVSAVALLVTFNIPRLRRAEGTFTGLRRTLRP
ncbi:MAG: undecaprenyl/decaprenyl-phosphate alpha-N-acetylglucosaminyl 1-phosphate transferase, partial [Actinomycetes bacterium]